MTKFADVVTLNTSRIADPLAAGIERFVGLEHIDPDDLHISSWGDVADGTTFTNHFKPGQVLFGKRRAYQRKVAVADFEGVCSGDIYVFESKDPDKLLPELLPFICQSEGFYEYAVRTSAGSLSPRTNWKHLAEYEFPLPPIDEQRRITKLLQAVEEAINSHKRLEASSDNLNKSFLYRWLSVIDDKFEFDEVPHESSFYRIGDLTPCIVPGRTKPKAFTGTLPWVTIADINSTILDSSQVEHKVSRDELNKVGGKIVPKDTVLLTCVGDLGVTSLTLGDVSFNQQIQAFKSTEKIIPEYLVFALRAQKRQMLSRAAQTTIPYLNKANCDALVIPYPSKDVQVQIGNFLLRLEKTSKSVKKRIEALSLLKKQLFSEIFKNL